MIRIGEARQARLGIVVTGQAGRGLAGMTATELKELRNNLGLSIAKAARQVEVSSRTWSRWESGTQTIPEGAIKLLRLLNKIDSLP